MARKHGNLTSLQQREQRLQSYGAWLPDVPDKRDYIYTSTTPILPKVDLRPTMSPVEHQGDIGSCSAQAWVALLEALDRRDDNQHTDLSRLFLYYNQRWLQGTTNQDAGAFIRDGAKALAHWGICAESLWPYYTKKFTEKPPVRAYTDAANNKISEYFRLNTVDDMMRCLSEGYAFTGGLSLYDSYESIETARTGVVSLPNVQEESTLGGHAVAFVGYDTEDERFIIRNSWGSWGQQGYGTVPFAYVGDDDLADDFWTIRK